MLYQASFCTWMDLTEKYSVDSLSVSMNADIAMDLALSQSLSCI